MMTLPTIVTAVYEQMVTLRRELHRNPELSWHEEKTATRIGRALEGLGVSYRSGLAGTGVVADIPGRNTKSLIALRADTDALPIQEETGLEFASKVDGVMHACGHDGHTSMLLGAAALLVREPELQQSVRLIFQPAEETGRGATAMIEAGALGRCQRDLWRASGPALRYRSSRCHGRSGQRLDRSLSDRNLRSRRSRRPAA